jgi:hypothetical protein
VRSRIRSTRGSGRAFFAARGRGRGARLDRGRDVVEQLGDVERLRQDAHDAVARRQPPRVRRHDDDRDLPAQLVLLEAAKHLFAGHHRQEQVERDRVGILGPRQPQRLDAGAGREDAVAGVLQRAGDDRLDVRIVFDDEDCALCGRHRVGFQHTTGFHARSQASVRACP